MITGVGVWEFFRIAKVPGFTIIGVLSSEVLVLFSFIGYRSPGMVPMPPGYIAGLGAIALIVGLLATLLIQIAVNRPHFDLSDLGIIVFGILYIGGIISLVFPMMRIFLDAYPDKLYMARVGLLLPLWAASGSDSFAYLTGSFIGRHPLSPKLSPKKTWEGLVGGFIFGFLGIIGIGLYMEFQWYHMVILGILSCSVAPVGDLAVSAIKREFNVKDTGKQFGPTAVFSTGSIVSFSHCL